MLQFIRNIERQNGNKVYTWQIANATLSKFRYFRTLIYFCLIIIKGHPRYPSFQLYIQKFNTLFIDEEHFSKNSFFPVLVRKRVNDIQFYDSQQVTSSFLKWKKVKSLWNG